jgi:uncharacterized protein (DUF2345 family)
LSHESAFGRGTGAAAEASRLRETACLFKWKVFKFNISTEARRGDMINLARQDTMNAPLKHLLFLTVLLVLAISTAHAAIDSAKVKKLPAGDGAAENEFGWSVSVSGDTAVIGTHGTEIEICAAYIFTRINGAWSQPQKLVPNTGGAIDDYFGYSVSVSGDTAIIGASGDDNGKGAAYIFTRMSNGQWTQQQPKLTATDGVAGDSFGISVSVSGDTAIIGASGHDSSKGAAYIFTRTGNTWSQQKKLTDNVGAANDHSGISVSVSGDTAIIGASGNNNRTGAAYVFTRTSGVWTQQGSKLTADDGVADDVFGSSVSVDGDTAIIGASGNETDKGAAYVFTRTSGVWTQQPKLTAPDGSEVDWFGSSVSMDGDTVVVGAYNNDNSKGAAYVFTRTSGVWTKLTATDGVADDYFGYSVAVDGNTVVVGAYGDDSAKGSAYVFGGPVTSQGAALPAINFLLLRN